MNPYLEDAAEEIKRVDHLVTVSLKYTRTVDVIRSVIERIISSYECLIETILQYCKEKKRIASVPTNPGLKVTLVQQTLKEDVQLQEYVAFYQLMRRLIRSPYDKREEYRRHVTMISKLEDGQVMNIDIDLLEEYFKKVKEFFKFTHALIGGKKDE